MARLHSLKRLDRTISRRLQQLPLRPAVRKTLAVIAHSADSAVVVPVLVLIWWRQGFSRSAIALSLGAGYLLSVLLTSALKYAFHRRRPAGEWGAFYRLTDPHSFPSGHASRTAALTLIAVGSGRLLVGLALFLWTLLVGGARIVLGVHYLYDVVAGYLLGLGIGAGIWLLISLGIVP